MLPIGIFPKLKSKIYLNPRNWEALKLYFFKFSIFKLESKEPNRDYKKKMENDLKIEMIQLQISMFTSTRSILLNKMYIHDSILFV